MAIPPTEAVSRAASLMVPGRALDIACGTGRHAIWLLEHGWQVTAVDRNAEAITQLHEQYPAIDSRVVDLEQAQFVIEPGSFDLIVCWLYYQRDLYLAIREGVRPGGVAAFSVLLQGRFAADPAELRECFSGWQVIHEAEITHSAEKRAHEWIGRHPVVFS